MRLITILRLIKANYNIVSNVVLGLSAAGLLGFGIITHKQNNRLRESLEIAQNNILAYQGIVSNTQQANNVLKLDMSQLQHQNDQLLQKIDSVRKELKINSKHISTAATQTQSVYVNKSKGVRGQSNTNNLVTILTKDSIYKDTIQYNNLTKVFYTIGKDTVNIAIDVKNTQYLYVYTKKQYKNKKSFIKRLFTLDFKKVRVHEYRIVNTNDLFKTSDTRVIESINK